MADILVVDDEIGIRELLCEILGDEGHSVLTAENAREARAVRDGHVLDLVLLDIWMPDTDGITLLKEWAANGKLTMPVIMMSGHATIDTAVEATRIGAFDFLEKPVSMQKLLRAVDTGLQRAKVPLTPPAPPVAASPAPAAARLPEPGRVFLPVNGAEEFRPIGAVTPGAYGGSGVPGASLQQPGAGGTLPEPVASPPPASNPGTLSTGRDLHLDLPLREARDAFERAYFEFHLSRELGSMTRVAEKTGLERTHLYRKLKQLGIDLSRGVWRKQAG
jgi:DNA-binding NtrC family response regulator